MTSRNVKKKGLADLKLKPPRRQGTSRPPTPKVDKVSGKPVFTGFVQGLKASTPEEMMARTLDKYQKEYAFRYRIPAVSGTYGLRGEKEVDFVISDGVIKPVQIADMTFIHHSPQQIAEDEASDVVVNAFFKDYGGVPVVWIDALDLATEDGADFKVKQLGLV